MRNIFYLLLFLKVFEVINISWFLVFLPVVMIGLYYNISLILAYIYSKEQNISLLEALDKFTKK